MGIVESSCGYRGHGVSIRVNSRNLGYEGSRHVAKRNSDPQQRYITDEPGKVQGRDSVGLVEVYSGYRARGVSIRGKFIEKPGVQDEGVVTWLK